MAELAENGAPAVAASVAEPAPQTDENEAAAPASEVAAAADKPEDAPADAPSADGSADAAPAEKPAAESAVANEATTADGAQPAAPEPTASDDPATDTPAPAAVAAPLQGPPGSLEKPELARPWESKPEFQPDADAPSAADKASAFEILKAALQEAAKKKIESPVTDALVALCLSLKRLGEESEVCKELMEPANIGRIGELCLVPLMGVYRKPVKKYTEAVRLLGRVKSYNTKKGFGFIDSAGTDRDIFVYNASLIGRIGLVPGETVEFEIIYDDGRPQARAVRVKEGVSAPMHNGPGAGFPGRSAENPLSQMKQAMMGVSLPNQQNTAREIALAMAAAAAEVPTTLPGQKEGGADKETEAQVYERIRLAQTQAASDKRKPMPQSRMDEPKLAPADWQTPHITNLGAAGMENEPEAKFNDEGNIPRGAYVRVFNFPANDVNNSTGIVQGYDAATARYAVTVEMKKQAGPSDSVPLQLREEYLHVEHVPPEAQQRSGKGGKGMSAAAQAASSLPPPPLPGAAVQSSALRKSASEALRRFNQMAPPAQGVPPATGGQWGQMGMPPNAAAMAAAYAAKGYGKGGPNAPPMGAAGPYGQMGPNPYAAKGQAGKGGPADMAAAMGAMRGGPGQGPGPGQQMPPDQHRRQDSAGAPGAAARGVGTSKQSVSLDQSLGIAGPGAGRMSPGPQRPGAAGPQGAPGQGGPPGQGPPGAARQQPGGGGMRLEQIARQPPGGAQPGHMGHPPGGGGAPAVGVPPTSIPQMLRDAAEAHHKAMVVGGPQGPQGGPQAGMPVGMPPQGRGPQGPGGMPPAAAGQPRPGESQQRGAADTAPSEGQAGIRWRVLQSKDFTDVIVRESKEVQSKLLKNMTPGQVVTQRGPSQRLASGLVRMPIEPEGWVTVHARYIGGPTFMEEVKDDSAPQGPSGMPGFASRPQPSAPVAKAPTPTAAPNPSAVPRSGLLGGPAQNPGHDLGPPRDRPNPPQDARQPPRGRDEDSRGIADPRQATAPGADQDVFAGARNAPQARTSPLPQRPPAAANNPPSTGATYPKEDLLRLQQRLLKTGRLDAPPVWDGKAGGKLRMLHIPTMDAGRSERRHRDKGDEHRKERGDRKDRDHAAGTSPLHERGGDRDRQGPAGVTSPPRERRAYEDDRNIGGASGAAAGAFLRPGQQQQSSGPLADAPAPTASAAAAEKPAGEAGAEGKKGQCPTQ